MKGTTKRRVTSIFLTTVITLALLFAGPISAVKVGFLGLPQQAEQDSTISFIAYVDIETNERVPIQNLTLKIKGATELQPSITCVFDLYGNNLTTCPGITITPFQPYVPYGYGYGYLYGYGYGYSPSYGYGTRGVSFGYGYGYSYGYGYGYPQSYASSELAYNITWNTTNLWGFYTVELSAKAVKNGIEYTFMSTPYQIFITPSHIELVVSVPSIPENVSSVSSGVIQTPIGNYEYVVYVNGTTIPVTLTVNVTVTPPTGVANLSQVEGAIPDVYWKITVSNESWYLNVSSIELRLYYDESDIPSGVSEDTLRPLRYTNGEWVRLDCSNLGGCPATLGDGTKVFGAGVNTASNFVWANLSRFSYYGIGGVKTAPSGGGGTTTTTTSSTTTTLAASTTTLPTTTTIATTSTTLPEEVTTTVPTTTLPTTTTIPGPGVGEDYTWIIIVAIVIAIVIAIVCFVYRDTLCKILKKKLKVKKK